METILSEVIYFNKNYFNNKKYIMKNILKSGLGKLYIMMLISINISFLVVYYFKEMDNTFLIMNGVLSALLLVIIINDLNMISIEIYYKDNINTNKKEIVSFLKKSKLLYNSIKFKLISEDASNKRDIIRFFFKTFNNNFKDYAIVLEKKEFKEFSFAEKMFYLTVMLNSSLVKYEEEMKEYLKEMFKDKNILENGTLLYLLLDLSNEGNKSIYILKEMDKEILISIIEEQLLPEFKKEYIDKINKLY